MQVTSSIEGYEASSSREDEEGGVRRGMVEAVISGEEDAASSGR